MKNRGIISQLVDMGVPLHQIRSSEDILKDFKDQLKVECKICKKIFVKDRANKVYCSIECRQLAILNRSKEDYNRIINRVCFECGKIFTSSRARKYCSQDCTDLSFFKRRMLCSRPSYLHGKELFYKNLSNYDTNQPKQEKAINE